MTWSRECFAEPFIDDQGMDPAPGTPEQFGALIKTDMDKWGEIGQRLGVRLD